MFLDCMITFFALHLLVIKWLGLGQLAITPHGFGNRYVLNLVILLNSETISQILCNNKMYQENWCQLWCQVSCSPLNCALGSGQPSTLRPLALMVRMPRRSIFYPLSNRGYCLVFENQTLCFTRPNSDPAYDPSLTPSKRSKRRHANTRHCRRSADFIDVLNLAWPVLPEIWDKPTVRR